MEVILYKTIQGDRWDTIAAKAYGDATKIKDLADANPGVDLSPVLPSGLTLNIPILDDAAQINAELLPIWKQ